MLENDRRDQSLLGRLRRTWTKYNPFNIDLAINKVLRTVDNIAVKVDNLHSIIDEDIKELERQNEHKTLLLNQIVNCLPDMVWFKDLEGNYVVANNSIRANLLCDSNPRGKNDIELAMAAKRCYGDDNHTFGEKCANSDKITLENDEPSRFLESGKVRGKMLYLEVFKAVVKDKQGNPMGVCGAGRDMTEYITAFKKSEGCGERDGCVATVLKKYEFGEQV
jgi:PAS domain-containing protein